MRPARVQRRTRLGAPWIVLVLLAALLPALCAAASDPLAGTRQMLARLDDTATHTEFLAVARELGELVDEVRQSDAERSVILTMRNLVQEMRARTQDALRRAEDATNESEAALERLYRSVVWDDLSFALAAFPYWRAWLELELARVAAHDSEKLKLLGRAVKGFRSASMQLFRPGLIYGGWLGLGYIAMEHGKHQRAAQIFETLEDALDDEADSPIRRAVTLELRLLRARQGNVTVAAHRPGTVLDDAEIALLKTEAQVLLQTHRKKATGGSVAAQRIKTLVDAGRVDEELLQMIIYFHPELAAYDIGPYTFLAGAEYALNYDHYYDAMTKYEAFFREVDPPPGASLDRFRYRWALAAYRGDILAPAIKILDQLSSKSDLEPDLAQSVAKLLYVVHAKREHAGGSRSNRKALRTAAQRFIASAPDDPDTDSARLMIAQTAANASTALRALDAVKAPQRFKGNVEKTAFHVISQEFTRKVQRGHISVAIGLARQGIKAWQKLPSSDKKSQYTFAVLLQMRALSDPHPENVLTSMQNIEQKPNINLEVRRAIMWSRLQIFDRMKDYEQAHAYVEGLARTGIIAWQLEYLYPWVADRDVVAERLEYARLLKPKMGDQPEMERRFWGMLIDGLLETEQIEAAYDEAIAFAKAHPTSGDAWRLLAQSAEGSGESFEADKAWKVITDKSVPTATIWWQGMLSRVRIRRDSTRPEAACPLLSELKQHSDYLPAAMQVEYDAAHAQTECSSTQAAL